MEQEIIKLLKSYKRKIGYDQKYEWDKIALKYMSECKTILDVGCGEGRFLAHDPQRIIGIDHNRKSVEVCRSRGFSVKFGKATNLPFRDASFDGVHCSHVIEHLLPEDAYKLLSELNRVLKKRGVLCLRTPLLHRNFYYDFTHIKPYYPQAVLHYLKTRENNERTLDYIEGLYKIVKLKYRKAQLFCWIADTPLWFLGAIFNILYKLGITSPERNGYMLILKKIK